MAPSLAAYYLAAAVLGYLLGSFPTGYLAGRLRGMDIREHGSGNIGATNVSRVLGKRIGFVVFVVDAIKGLLAVSAGQACLAYGLVAAHGSLFGDDASARAAALHTITLGCMAAALACIIGHNYPCWLKFRGGKGISTTFGVMLALMPVAMLVAMLVWLVFFYALRYVSVASLAAAATLPVSVTILWMVGWADPALIFFSLLAAALAIWRHRTNLQRLRDGTEPRVAPKAPTPAA